MALAQFTTPDLPVSETAWARFGLGKLLVTDGVEVSNFHGNYASGSITVTGTNGTVIPKGTTFSHLNGETLYYSTFKEATISAGTIDIEVVAQLTLIGSGVASGETLNLQDNISGLDTTATVGADGIISGKVAAFADVEPVLLPPTGFVIQNIVDASSLENSVFSAFSVLPVDDSQLVFEESKAQVGRTGIFSSSFVGTQTMYLFDPTDNNLKPFTVQTITSGNNPPVFTSTPPTTATENSAYTYTPTASDADNGDTVTITATIVPAWLTFAGGILSGTPTFGDIGSHIVSIQADDATITVDQTFTITVSGILVPTTKVAPITGVVDYAGANVTQLYDFWYLTSSDIEAKNKAGQSIVVINSGAALQITNGVGSVEAPNSVVGQSYTLESYTSDKTHVMRATVTITEV